MKTKAGIDVRIINRGEREQKQIFGLKYLCIALATNKRKGGPNKNGVGGRMGWE